MIRLVIAGAGGRMACRIMTLALQSKAFSIAGAFEAKDHPAVGKSVGALLGVEGLPVRIVSNAEEAIAKGDVLIDFTHASATPAHVRISEASRKAMVIGTTGLEAKSLAAIKKAAKTIPIVQSPNMSAGVNLLFNVVEKVAATLGEEYDIEIVETHHRHKKDSPSGTALELARRAALGRKIDLEKEAVYGRKGFTGERKKGTIGIHAVRGGDVVGEHIVSFLAEGELLELTHRATSRDAFAQGALLAARFVAGKKNGLYTMHDVLGL